MIVLEYWSAGVLEYWSTGVLGYWSTGVLEYWSAGVPEYWGAGVLEYWCAGVLVSMVGERAWGFIPPTERIRTGCALGSGWGPAPQSPPGVRWSPPLRVGPLLRVRVLEYWTTGVLEYGAHGAPFRARPLSYWPPAGLP